MQALKEVFIEVTHLLIMSDETVDENGSISKVVMEDMAYFFKLYPEFSMYQQFNSGTSAGEYKLEEMLVKITARLQQV